MQYSKEDYELRARECARLAGDTADQLIKFDLLKLQQTYLAISKRLDGRKDGVNRAGSEAP